MEDEPDVQGILGWPRKSLCKGRWKWKRGLLPAMRPVINEMAEQMHTDGRMGYQMPEGRRETVPTRDRPAKDDWMKGVPEASVSFGNGLGSRPGN